MKNNSTDIHTHKADKLFTHQNMNGKAGTIGETFCSTTRGLALCARTNGRLIEHVTEERRKCQTTPTRPKPQPPSPAGLALEKRLIEE